jgi:hypothetical protein
MLREVRSMHFEVIRASGKFDYIINDLVPIIESMLDHDVEERPSAKQVRKACRSALDRANGVLEKDTNVLPEAFRMEPEVTLRSRKIPRVSGSPDQYGLGVVLPHRPHAPLATQSEPVTNGVYSTPYSNRAPGRNSKQRSIDTVFSDEKIQQTPELSDLHISVNEADKVLGNDDTAVPGSPPAQNVWRTSPQQNEPRHKSHPSGDLRGRSERTSLQGQPNAERRATIDEVHTWILEKKRLRGHIHPTFEDLLSECKGRILKRRDQVKTV